MTDWLVVAPRGEVFHAPADGCHEFDPVPKCADEAGYYRADWDTRRRDMAVAWHEPCSWCFGDPDRTTGTPHARAIGGESGD